MLTNKKKMSASEIINNLIRASFNFGNNISRPLSKRKRKDSNRRQREKTETNTHNCERIHQKHLGFNNLYHSSQSSCLYDQERWTSYLLSYVPIYFCSANWMLVGLSCPLLLPAFLSLLFSATSDSYFRQS